MYQPPYTVTQTILKQITAISSKLGEINAAHLNRPSPELRKKNRIRTIQSSLAIEGNTLNEEQITALFENKRVIGPERDIKEVQNAISVYSRLTEFTPVEYKSFLKAHKIFMDGLIDSAGKYRAETVGIVKGDVVTHLAPPAIRVYPLMLDLFSYLKESEDLILIKSCVFHYEMEFIHPFMDGNGRMGRLWQTLILIQEYPVFEFLPLETVIKDRQEAYYESLSASDKAGESSQFIEFMLGIIEEALEGVLKNQQVHLNSADRINRFQSIIKGDAFSRKDYMRFFKEISSATASRDLKKAVEAGVLSKYGHKRLTTYTFKQ
ncbi:MAG: Fic family protein [Bacteroidota bacterium]